MDKIIHETSFPSPQYSTQHLLNCCRVLSRIIPYLYEQGNEEWEFQFWWTNYQRKIHDQQSKKETPITRGDLLLSCKNIHKYYIYKNNSNVIAYL